jgi:hypothetical protein
MYLAHTIIIKGYGEIMVARILKVGEKVTGRYRDMTMGQSKKFFRLNIDDQEIYLPKDVGNSLLRSRQQGNEVFTIARTVDVYEIRPAMERD